MDQAQRGQNQRMALLWAFIGLAIGAGLYQGSKLAFSQLDDSLTKTAVMNAAAATTFTALLIFVVLATVWTRHSRRAGHPRTVDSGTEAGGEAGGLPSGEQP